MKTATATAPPWGLWARHARARRRRLLRQVLAQMLATAQETYPATYPTEVSA